jgi:hypothetical protein
MSFAFKPHPPTPQGGHKPYNFEPHPPTPQGGHKPYNFEPLSFSYFLIKICHFFIRIIPCVNFSVSVYEVEVEHGKVARTHRGMDKEQY